MTRGDGAERRGGEKRAVSERATEELGISRHLKKTLRRGVLIYHSRDYFSICGLAR